MNALVLARRLRVMSRVSKLKPAAFVAVVVAASVVAGSVVVGGSGAAGGSQRGSFKVKSTLTGKKVLPHRIHWIARPQPITGIDEVDFLIDGKTRWIEFKPPYTYGDDGNWLVTSWLSPGRHRFTVRAKTSDGRTAAQRTTIARVLAADPPPAELSGSWKRTVTQEEAGKTTPGGTWLLSVDKTGWRVTDPREYTNYIDVAYLTGSRLEARGGIWTRPSSGSNFGGNGWCAHTNAPVDYQWSVAADALTLTLDGPDRCGSLGDEQHRIWAGSWTKVP